MPTESSTNDTAQHGGQDAAIFDADRCHTACAETVSDGVTIDEALDGGGKPTGRSEEFSEDVSGEKKPEELSENASEEDQRDGKKGGIDRPSVAVRHRPFRRSTAFFVGHHNRLGNEALELCDFLVHVEQVRKLCSQPTNYRTKTVVAIFVHTITIRTTVASLQHRYILPIEVSYDNVSPPPPPS